ncbi:hypothetical protein TGDOM2_400530 [Toxoplasma gondii GAB2-2007-GAL-DOM2]|uniref:Uncharacterized protein n=1 Tax=Toxoplasma gondii GAB2-2007-GAL-DOM2 TaxID=1130820 RepID=A0A086JQX2_TOXGO|nr:hypothetical protein TGDOM2_400530 [Toxoplasma gondii GAB2-2007-GAL-DOM2]
MVAPTDRHLAMRQRRKKVLKNRVLAKGRLMVARRETGLKATRKKLANNCLPLDKGRKKKKKIQILVRLPLRPALSPVARTVLPYQGNHQLITPKKIKALPLCSTLRVKSQKKRGGLTMMKAMKVKTLLKNPAAST